jgi:hypothetical protein
MACGIREKPKKADFVYKKQRFWIKQCIRHTGWGEGEYDLWSEFDIRRFEDDSEFYCYDDIPEKELEDYLVKEEAACERIFPYTYGDWDFEH